MSYILEALRKADAQRVRDPARGIHAQVVHAPLAGDPGGGRGRGAQWLAGSIAVLVLAAMAWIFLRSDEQAAAPQVALVAPRATLPMAEPVPAPPPASVVLPPPPPPLPVAATVLPQVRRAATPAAEPARASSSMPAVPAPAPAAAGDRVYNLAELPDDARQALPKFSVSGGVYSENVAQRMLIVNSQVFNEGSEIAPGVVLEQVRPRNALLKFRGLRISQPY